MIIRNVTMTTTGNVTLTIPHNGPVEWRMAIRGRIKAMYPNNQQGVMLNWDTGEKYLFTKAQLTYYNRCQVGDTIEIIFTSPEEAERAKL